MTQNSVGSGIYLDNSFGGRPSERVINKMIPYFSDCWGVPSAPHKVGQRVYPAMAEALEAIYALLGASADDDFVFTSGAAEGVNHVVSSVFYDVSRTTGKNHFVVGATDEAPATMATGVLEREGCVVGVAAAHAGGYISADAVAEAITPRTALVSLSWANGLTGVVNAVCDVGALCRDRGILFHLDASHVLGKHYFDLAEVDADFVTFDGEQIHAPAGTGGLYVKKGNKLSPFIRGGMEQGGRRAGSVNVAGMVALGAAAVEALDSQDLLCTEVARLRDKLEAGITAQLLDAVVLFKDNERVPHCTAIAFPGVASEAMAYALDRRGVYASMGGGSFQQITRNAAASGVESALAQCVVSFSLSRTNTEEEIGRAVDIVVDTAQRLKRVSQHLSL